eukprot:2024419-Amphidinium_carterae.1
MQQQDRLLNLHCLFAHLAKLGPQSHAVFAKATLTLPNFSIEFLVGSHLSVPSFPASGRSSRAVR